MMEIKTDGDKIVEVKIGLMTLSLKDVRLKDVDTLESHVKYFEEHIPTAEEGFSWTKEELFRLLDKSSVKQLRMIKELLKYPDGIKTKDLIQNLGLRASPAMAGLMAGFTRRAKRDFGNKHPFIDQKWSHDLWMNIYWIKKQYFNIIKEYFNNKKID